MEMKIRMFLLVCDKTQCDMQSGQLSSGIKSPSFQKVWFFSWYEIKMQNNTLAPLQKSFKIIFKVLLYFIMLPNSNFNSRHSKDKRCWQKDQILVF